MPPAIEAGDFAATTATAPKRKTPPSAIWGWPKLQAIIGNREGEQTG
jgi:hypothetical protein